MTDDHNVIPLPPLKAKMAQRPEPKMQLIGEGKYRYAVLKDGDIEVMHRVPLYFFLMSQDKKEAMAKEICQELRKKLIRAKGKS